MWGQMGASPRALVLMDPDGPANPLGRTRVFTSNHGTYILPAPPAARATAGKAAAVASPSMYLRTKTYLSKALKPLK